MLRRLRTSQALPVRTAFGVAGVLLGVGLVGLILKWAPEWLAQKGLGPKDKAEEIGRVRTALLAALAGVIAIIGAVFTGLSYRLNRAGQITERFTRAIEQLGSSELDVRLGGIYALERIARDSRDDHPQVVEVLTAYVREHAPWPPKASTATDGEPGSDTLVALTEAIRALERVAKGTEPGADSGSPAARGQAAADPLGDEPPALPTDVQAVMSVLGRRVASQDKLEARLNLAGTDLRRLMLRPEEANFQGSDSYGANLQNAFLDEANFHDVRLDEASFQCASLESAKLDGSYLRRANFQSAKLPNANLQGSRLGWANFEDAEADGANFENTRLGDANFQNASLMWANFHNARLDGARLQGAFLLAADLRNAHLDGANLQGASFSGHPYLEDANLQGALYDDNTTWPEGFAYRAAGARHVDEEEEPGSVPPSG